MRQAVIQLTAFHMDTFVYVDCGARGEVENPLLKFFPDAKYVGFEPDAEESVRLTQNAKDGYSYFPVAVGKQSETRTLYLTQNPSCSSLLVPNQSFLNRFLECGPFFNIIEKRPIQVVALDVYLSQKGIRDVDFIEIDTQGTELDILQGAEGLLSSNVLGLKVEVEFSEMYQGQPLFSDVDAYVRSFGFVLFDLQRYFLRRQACPRDVKTRGQLLWGQAFYLKDYNLFSSSKQDSKQKMAKLALIASFYGFHGYALEITDFLLQGGAGSLSAADKSKLEVARTDYLSSLQNNWMVRLMLLFDRSPLRKLFHQLGAICATLWETYSFVLRKRNYFWKD